MRWRPNKHFNTIPYLPNETKHYLGETKIQGQRGIKRKWAHSMGIWRWWKSADVQDYLSLVMQSRVQDLGGKLKTYFGKGCESYEKSQPMYNMYLLMAVACPSKFVVYWMMEWWMHGVLSLHDGSAGASLVAGPGVSLRPVLTGSLAPVQPEPESHIVISSVRPGWASSALASQPGEYWSGRKGDVRCEVSSVRQINLTFWLCFVNLYWDILRLIAIYICNLKTDLYLLILTFYLYTISFSQS